jgi:hypothetical protein
MSSGHGGHPLPLYDQLDHFLHGSQGEGVHISANQLMIVFVLMVGIFFFVDPVQTVNNFELVLFLTPIWVPWMLFGPTIYRFVETRRAEFFAKQQFVLLELRLPRETLKTPLAMETFFSSINIGSGEATWYKKYILGSVRPWWSFEIVSLGGRVHFYIWSREGYRRYIETYLYAQYPQIEIIEAEDYSRIVEPTSSDWEMWGCEYKKGRENPIPIKTYTDYGLDKPGAKPEENVDPLAQLIEFMGSLGPGEQFWLQFIVRMSRTEAYPSKNGKPQTWRDEAAELVQKLREKTTMTTTYVDPATGEQKTNVGFANPTEGQRDGIKAIERNVSKQAFDVGIRAIYSAPKDVYQGITVPGMLNLFKPFNSETGNQISLQIVWSAIFNDFPWEDRSGHHQRHIEHEIIRLYRQRQYFYPPYKGQWSIFSTEELATLFHIPSSMVSTPNLPRIQSATTSAPANLPK